MADAVHRRGELLAAYEATSYEAVDAETGLRVVARIGRLSPEIDRLLARHGAASGTFMTAWNPRSVPQSEVANRQVHARLIARLDADGLRRLPHEGVSPDGDWREEGVFLLDAAEQDVLALAEAFGQNAVVRIEAGGAARLLTTRLMPAD